jgi:hypothetical protein
VLPAAAALARRAELTEWVPRSALAASGPPGSAVRARLVRASAYAAEASLQAGQWLGSFLLLSALIAGVLLFVELQGGGWFESRYLPVWEAACAGCGLAGALLFALVIRTRHRRQARRAGIALPRWLTLRATAALLVVIAVTEYWIIASNANGRLSGAVAPHPAWQCLYWVAIGAQFAAMLMGAACAVRWMQAGWRVAERASPDGTHRAAS